MKRKHGSFVCLPLLHGALSLLGMLSTGCSASSPTALMPAVDAAMDRPADLGMAASYRWIPDTGQTTSYTSTAGEDADYLINPQQLVDRGDGTVSESVTQLLWQKIDGGEMTFEAAQAYVNTLTLAARTGWRLPTPQEALQLFHYDANNPALDGKVFPASSAEYYATHSVCRWLDLRTGGCQPSRNFSR